MYLRALRYPEHDVGMIYRLSVGCVRSTWYPVFLLSQLCVTTPLRLERDAWLMIKCLRQATNEYAPAPPPSYDYGNA